MASQQESPSANSAEHSTSSSAGPAITARHHFDELRWLIQIRSTLREVVEEEEARTPVSVFCVPKALTDTKPEAYVPQMFALGPYHHWDAWLFEMERYKLATARKTQGQLLCQDMEQVVQYFIKKKHKIRSHYHRYLDFNDETLAWMMAVDASFLLEFLRNYSDDGEGRLFSKVPSMSHMVDSERMKLAYNSILRDVVMLENQIPLFLVRKILCFQLPSPADSDAELSKMLLGFLREVCPFRVTDNVSLIRSKRSAHLLQLLYHFIVAKAREVCEEYPPEMIEDAAGSGGGGREDIGRSLSFGTKLFESVWSQASGLKVLQVLRPLFTQFSIILTPITKTFVKGAGETGEEEEGSSAGKPPLVEEITIPSVTELMRAGVKFLATAGDLTTMEFNRRTATLRIPAVSLDVNTEVVLRNLVAYEASVEPGPMIFTRYTELMNGIIDSEEDVRLLRESGIIVNRMKSDGEVAKLWNGMSNSVRLSKVAFIDRIIVDVNTYYNNRWSVKMRKFVGTYVFESWQLLTFLAAILMLLLTCVQTFCSVYSCSYRWLNLLNSNVDQ